MRRRWECHFTVLALVVALSGCKSSFLDRPKASTAALPPEPALIAHRGASYDAPENTLAAVNLAWKRRADAVEVDVHLSKDDQVVVIHDATTARTGGRDEAVQSQTLAELRQLDVGSYKGERWAGERIPALSEVMKTVPEGRRLFVEIKTGEAILPPLREVLQQSNLPPEQVVLIGFGRETMAAAKQMLPAYSVLWLSGMQERDDGMWTPGVEELIQKAKQAGVDGLDVRATEAVDEAFARQVREAGLSLYVWTVNDPAVARRMQQAGVAGITTDRPLWLRKKLAPSADFSEASGR